MKSKALKLGNVQNIKSEKKSYKTVCAIFNFYFCACPHFPNFYNKYRLLENNCFFKRPISLNLKNAQFVITEFKYGFYLKLKCSKFQYTWDFKVRLKIKGSCGTQARYKSKIQISTYKEPVVRPLKGRFPLFLPRSPRGD